jgi:hypothetical protein
MKIETYGRLDHMFLLSGRRSGGPGDAFVRIISMGMLFYPL